MTVEYEPAPKPAPLWLVPLVIALLALGLLWAVQQFTDRTIGGFGGPAQPATPMPQALVDGSPLPEVPEELTRRFGDEVVLAKRIDDNVPRRVERRCTRAYSGSSDPALQRLSTFIESGAVSAAHIGPDALTYLTVNVADTPPGYPREVQIACVARSASEGWVRPRAPLLDFALDGRPGATLPALTEEIAAPGDDASDASDASASEEVADVADAEAEAEADAPADDPAASEASSEGAGVREHPAVRTRLTQIPVGAQWAVQPRGGWWLAYDVSETSWALLTLNDAVDDSGPMRVVFVDSTGAVVSERGVGPTRSAAQADHATDLELVAGPVDEVLSRLGDGPVRVCEPGNRNLCVWLNLNELDEVLAFGAFGPHPLDTPPLGYIGYCPKAGQLQGSVTTARFRTDGSWAGGPAPRGLDRYTVRFEANMVVVDLSEHVTGDQAGGEPDEGNVECEFEGRRARGRPPR